MILPMSDYTHWGNLSLRHDDLLEEIGAAIKQATESSKDPVKW